MNKKLSLQSNNQNNLRMKTLTNYKIVLHVLGALMVCMSPLLMSAIWDIDGLSWNFYLKFTMGAFSLFIIYILNYYAFIPKYLFNNLKLQFFLWNFVALILLILIMSCLREYAFEKPEHFLRSTHSPNWMWRISRDLSSLILTIGFAIAVRMTGRFVENAMALKEAESARTSAELLNLRNQINPHFLLNTLNNIYALIAFNTDKAQESVQKLSTLLRYVLYDNKEETVLLTKEIDFLSNYIELMRIRLAKNVEVKTCFAVSKTSTTRIAPLIFISLIENAFKHGVNPLEPSYIHIYIEDMKAGKEVLVCIENSNYPKQENDKSGNGIGLEQVRKRLELLYKNRYDWKIISDTSNYKSELLIKTKQL